MAVSAVLFALMNLFARIASGSTSWLTVASMRALVGAGVAFAAARARGVSLAVVDRRILFWRSLFGTIAMTSTFYALSSRSLPLGDTVTLFNLAPVFLAILAPIFLHERTSRGVAVGIAIALTGVVLVVRPSFLFPSASHPPAGEGPSASVTAAVAVFAALSTSIAMMMLRRARGESAEAIAIHFSLFAALVTGVLSLFDLRMPTASGALATLAAGICAGFAQLAMTRAYALERAARVGGMSYLSVVASAVLGAVQLGEVPSLVAILGMALVVAGGIVVSLRSAPS